MDFTSLHQPECIHKLLRMSKLNTTTNNLLEISNRCRVKVPFTGETYRVGDIINHNGCLSTSVVHRSQAVVTLLTRRVPNLKLHCGVIQTHSLSEEGSYGTDSKTNTITCLSTHSRVLKHLQVLFRWSFIKSVVTIDRTFVSNLRWCSLEIHETGLWQSAVLSWTCPQLTPPATPVWTGRFCLLRWPH